MLDIRNIIDNHEEVKKKLGKRKLDIKVIDDLLVVASKRSKIMTELQMLEAERNSLSKKIGELKSKKADASAELKRVGEVKESIDKIKDSEVQINIELQKKLLMIPNVPNDNVPQGKDESDNKIIKEHAELGRGKITKVKAHYDIALELDIVDFERAVKMSGTRFWAYKGLGAKLVRSLENFMLDTHLTKGYEEFRPPVLVNTKAMYGTGQLPKFSEDLFKIEGLDLYLIPTAETPLTNFYADEIIDLTKPKMLTAFTPCFRAEAGSGGKDMRGLIRSHQFNKVELVKITSREDLEEEYKKTVLDAKAILELLELPFQELQLCSGDLGFSSEETIDLEVWIPSENRYREISSVSRFGDFQGRRCNIRYRDKDGKNVIACTINGSGLAIDRTVAAILENYQNEDGSVTIPKALVKYMGVDKITKEKNER